MVPIPASCDSPTCFAEGPEGGCKRAYETLRDSEERFRMIADSCPSIMWATNAEGMFDFTNKACCQFFGLTHEELKCTKRGTLTHPDEAPGFLAAFNRAVCDRTTFRMEARFQRADAEWRLLGVFAEPRLSSSGEYLGHIGLMADITERNRAELERQFELSLIQSIHAETMEGILVVNQAGVIVSYNRRFLDIWGIDDSTAQGSQPHSFIGAVDHTLLSLVIERLEAPDSFVRRVQELYSHPDEKDHCEIKLKDGRTLERHSTGLRNSDGTHLGRVWFFRDITPHKQAEASLQQAIALADEANQRLLAKRSMLDDERRMLRALIDNIPDFMYVKDLKSRFVVANAHLAHAVGAETPEELTGRTDYDFFPREMANGFFADEQNLFRSGQPIYNREETALDSAGNEIHILTTKVPLCNSQGQVIGIAGVGHDITERKKMENALREAEQKFRGIFDQAIVGVFQSSPEGRLLIVNPSLASAFGYDSPEEMIHSVADLNQQFYTDPERRKEFMFIMASFGSVQNFECEATRKDGSKMWITMSARAILQDGVVVRYEGMGEDISERKKIENDLFEAERKYRGIFDNAIIGIFQSTPDGRVLSVNQAMARIYGYDSPEELITSVTDIAHHSYVDPKQREEFKLRMAKNGCVQNFEYESVRKDGSKSWIVISAVAIQENGEVIRYEGMMQDVSERNQLREQLLQAQKLESVGQLAAGIAHEINTPTQYIGDNVRFLKDAFQDMKSLLVNYERLLLAAKSNNLSAEVVKEVEAALKTTDAGYLLEEIPKAIDQTLEGVIRVATLVSAMKEFSHPDTKEKTLLDLNRSINSTITVARNEWKYVAEMETDFDPSLPMVSCLPGEFNQVILNLIVNAAHAIADVIKMGGSGKGKIKVETRNYRAWAEIRIQDTGSGIPDKIRARIFDPFFTTKEIGKGTGQGLAIARSVVVGKHGGTIHFESEEGKGTTFIIRLPYDGKDMTAKAVAA
ncbi:MAG: PAS domain S-box protein [Terracidiphilus sp.]